MTGRTPHQDEISDSAGAGAALFSGVEDLEDQRYFRMRSSGSGRVTIADLETANPDRRVRTRRRPLAGLAALAALVCALAAAAPGAAAGLVPLGLDAIARVFPVLAALFAGIAAILALTSGRTDRPAPTPGLARRPVFAGTGLFTITLGAYGLQQVYARRFWRARWSAFDAATLMAADMNGGDLAQITLAEAEGVSLEALLSSADTGNAAVERLIAASSAWAERNAVLRLPLKIDREFAVRTGPKGAKRAFAAGTEREFLVLHKRQFTDSSEGDVGWARFVAACVFMIQVNDPNWVENADP